MATQTNCGGLMFDESYMEVDGTTKKLRPIPTQLLKDQVAYISVPTTFETLSVAQDISLKLRNALIACGAMLEDEA